MPVSGFKKGQRVRLPSGAIGVIERVREGGYVQVRREDDGKKFRLRQAALRWFNEEVS